MKRKMALLLSLMMLSEFTVAIPVAAEAGQATSNGSNVQIPSETTYLPYNVCAVIKPEYEKQAENWNSAFLNENLGIDCIYDVWLLEVRDTDDYLLTDKGKYLDITLNLQEDERVRANAVFAVLNEAEWFDTVVANWFPTQEEDTSLPLQIPSDDCFSGRRLYGYVKYNYSEEAMSWDADFLNRQLMITTIQKLWPINIQEKTGRGYFTMTLTDDSWDTAVLTAQKLYNTGWFYSIEIPNSAGASEPGIEEASINGMDEPLVRMGDVNGNERVDIMDVILVNKHVMIGDKLSDTQKKAADVDRNSIVNARDSLMILKEVVEITEGFVEK